MLMKDLSDMTTDTTPRLPTEFSFEIASHLAYHQGSDTRPPLNLSQNLRLLHEAAQPVLYGSVCFRGADGPNYDLLLQRLDIFQKKVYASVLHWHIMVCSILSFRYNPGFLEATPFLA